MDDNPKQYDVVYMQTNDFRDNQNAVLAYRDNGNGELMPLAGSPFYTKGSGVGNPEQIIGPLDSDYELRITQDKKFLLTVNSGSNTIAVFSIKSNGSLEHVPGSPFASGGQTPVSIDVAENYVFVVNKSQDPLHVTKQAPNYAAFIMNDQGALTPVPGGLYETTPGTSPGMALISRDKKFLFGYDFLGFMLNPPVGTLRSFNLYEPNPAVPGTPYFVPGNAEGKNGALGLWQHPKDDILYVGFPLLKQVGIYGVNPSSGALSFKSAVPAGAAACWIRTNKSGNRMYVLNSGDNTVQVYNTSNSSSPVVMQVLELKQSGPVYMIPGVGDFKTSEPFSLALSTSEKFLYIVNQHTNKDFSIGNFNYLHLLKVSDDGMLTEVSEPLQLPVPNTVRPKGSAVIRRM